MFQQMASYAQSNIDYVQQMNPGEFPPYDPNHQYD